MSAVIVSIDAWRSGHRGAAPIRALPDIPTARRQRIVASVTRYAAELHLRLVDVLRVRAVAQSVLEAGQSDAFAIGEAKQLARRLRSAMRRDQDTDPTPPRAA